ncbi:hypothetical protein NE237_028137 [Protea cynaroides]|uniref:Uncharacterized protein n=1 Tax=Protea cynaroides TaxID=273540 RepID=A0A9Q0JUU7_9MAGN|nr:hypothetical protein NE237_028137 [Protea cynaroides]
MQLHRLLSSEQSLETVLAWIRSLNPKIVTMVEQEANHNQPGFLERFTEALYYYSTMFDSLEACKFGLGVVMGARIFILTGLTSREQAGPVVVLSFFASGVSALLFVLCYTKFAVEIPVIGGSFAYLCVELGDFVTLSPPSSKIESSSSLASLPENKQALLSSFPSLPRRLRAPLVLCYTEFTVEIPVAGGSFTYLRVEFRDFIAFIVAGNILFEYIIAGASVASEWTFKGTEGVDAGPGFLHQDEICSIAELVAAMAVGWNVKLIMEEWRRGGIVSTSIGLAVTNRHTQAGHVCMVLNELSRSEYMEAMMREAGISPEVMVGETEEVMEGIPEVDFLVVDCWRKDYAGVLRKGKLSPKGEVLCASMLILKGLLGGGKELGSGAERWGRCLARLVCGGGALVWLEGSFLSLTLSGGAPAKVLGGGCDLGGWWGRRWSCCLGDMLVT